MTDVSTPPPGSPITASDLQAIRASLPALAAGIYLNAGTLGPLPRPAIEAIERVHRYDVDHRQTSELWTRLVELQGEARGAVASLTGVATDQVALMHSTHEGINSCLWGLGAGAGDSIVTTSEEHPGVLIPLRHVRDRSHIDVRIAPWTHDGDDRWLESMTSSIDATTRAIVVSHVSWVTGAIAPLARLRAAVSPDVRIIVDGAQAAGVLAVDPSDGWDAYTVSGQKWPCGPNGSGGLALVEPSAWLPTFGGFQQVEDPVDGLGSALCSDGRRLETSQEAMGPLAGFAASCRWLVESVGLWRAESHARLLNAHARQLLLAIPEIAALDAQRPGGCVERAALRGDAHLLCVDLPGGGADDVVEALSQAGVSIRSLGSDVVRLSFGCWTSIEEVDRCITLVATELDRRRS